MNDCYAYLILSFVDGRKWSCCFNQLVDKSCCRFQIKKLKIHLVAKKLLPDVHWPTYEVCCLPLSYFAVHHCLTLLFTIVLLYCSPLTYCSIHQCPTLLFTIDLLCCSPLSYFAVHHCCTLLFTIDLLCCSPLTYSAVHHCLTLLFTSDLLCCSPVTYSAV